MKKLLVLFVLYIGFAQTQDMSWLPGEWQGQDMNPSFTLLFSFAESGRLVVTALQDGKLAATEVGTWELQDDGLHLSSNFFGESVYGFATVNEELFILTGTFAGESRDPSLDTLSLQKTNAQLVTLAGSGEAFDGRQLVGRWQQPGSPYILTLHPDNSYQLQIDNNEVPPGERGFWSLAGGQFRLIADSDDLLVFDLSSFSDSAFTLSADGSGGDEIIFEKVP